MMEKYKQWFIDHRDTILSDFYTFLKFPSISTDSSYQKDMQACADWLIDYFQSIGYQSELWETSGHPTVFAEHLKAGASAPTLLFYLHYDVQPVTPLEEWKTPPFEPNVHAGKVVARGAIDNKGQCFYTLTALKAVQKLTQDLSVNVKVCIEGEEEVGSAGLEGILNEKKACLQADYFLVVDFDMLGEKKPAITLGMRGIATLNITCTNSSCDLHSGTFGGVVFNPARALSQALGSLWNEEGHIAVPHFYDEVRKYEKEELKDFYWDVNPKEFANSFKVGAFCSEKGASLLESNWLRPTLEINGMQSGYNGEGVKTIIPSKASAKLSCRLVPDQDPEKILKLLADFLKKKIPKGIDVKLELGQGARGLITSPHSQLAKLTAKAFETVFKTPCRRILCGATIPIVPALAEVSGAELVMTGVGLPEDGMHAPNESFALERLTLGYLSIAKLLHLLSEECHDNRL